MSNVLPVWARSQQLQRVDLKWQIYGGSQMHQLVEGFLAEPSNAY